MLLLPAYYSYRKIDIARWTSDILLYRFFKIIEAIRHIQLFRLSLGKAFRIFINVGTFSVSS